MTSRLECGFPSHFGVVDAQRLQRGQELGLPVTVYGRNPGPDDVAGDDGALGETAGQSVRGRGSVARVGLEDIV